MEYIILVLVTGCLCIWSFFIGAKLGQTVVRGEEIQIPSPVYREHRAHRQAREQQSRLETIMHNIDNYDGTSNGQEEVT